MQNEYFKDFVAFALGNEEEASEFYDSHAKKTHSAAQRILLTDMAEMERRHAAKLIAFMDDAAGTSLSTTSMPHDMHIADYAVTITLTDKSTLEDVFLYSIQAEEKAYQLYSRLANLESDPEVKALFLSLAAEEQHHKKGLETEYEEAISPEN